MKDADTKLYMRQVTFTITGGQVTFTITGADRDEVRQEAALLENRSPHYLTNIRVSSTQEKLVERGED